MPPTQITDPAQLVGKAIIEVVPFSDGRWTTALGLIFGDGSFFRVAIERGYDDDAGVSWEDAPESLSERVAFGLMTAGERDRIEAEAREREEARRDDAERRE